MNNEELDCANILCPDHPEEPIIRVCLLKDCDNPLICLECLQNHEKSHNKYFVSPENFMEDYSSKKIKLKELTPTTPPTTELLDFLSLMESHQEKQEDINSIDLLYELLKEKIDLPDQKMKEINESSIFSDSSYAKLILKVLLYLLEKAKNKNDTDINELFGPDAIKNYLIDDLRKLYLVIQTKENSKNLFTQLLRELYYSLYFQSAQTSDANMMGSNNNWNSLNASIQLLNSNIEFSSANMQQNKKMVEILNAIEALKNSNSIIGSSTTLDCKMLACISTCCVVTKMHQQYSDVNICYEKICQEFSNFISTDKNLLLTIKNSDGKVIAALYPCNSFQSIAPMSTPFKVFIFHPGQDINNQVFQATFNYSMGLQNGFQPFIQKNKGLFTPSQFVLVNGNKNSLFEFLEIEAKEVEIFQCSDLNFFCENQITQSINLFNPSLALLHNQNRFPQDFGNVLLPQRHISASPLQLMPLKVASSANSINLNNLNNLNGLGSFNLFGSNATTSAFNNDPCYLNEVNQANEFGEEYQYAENT